MRTEAKFVFVLLLILSVCVGAAFASGEQETAPEAPASEEMGGSVHESPMLREQVQSGELPALEERLPEEPLTLPTESIGKYGGTLRRAWYGPSDAWGLEKLTWTNLFRFDPNANIVPDVAKSYEISDDGTVLRIELREGLKWSDGEPFTVEDIDFVLNDILLNKEINPVPDSAFKGLKELRKINDYEFELVHKTPGAMATLMHSMLRFYDPWTSYAKHYFKQFHASYRDSEELNAEAREAGYDGWVQYIMAKGADEPGYKAKDCPYLGPWIPVNDSDSQVFVLERNPYYHAVDSEGNQLPYIDEVENLTVSDKEVMLLQISQGNIDIQGRSISLGDIQALKASESQGNYTVRPVKSSMAAAMKMEMNLTNKDPFKRKFFQDVRVRRALSLAVDRQEMNEVGYFGQGVPRQLSFVPQSPSYSEKWENAYTEYDPDRARALLDDFISDVGTTRDNKGFIVDPNTGKRMVMFFDTFGGGYASGATQDLELLKKYFADIGVAAKLRTMDRALYDERADANELDTQFWPGSNGLRPDAAVDKWDGGYWEPWSTWRRTGGSAGEKPTDPKVLEVFEILDSMDTAFQEKERIDLMKQLGLNYAENLWEIGFVGLTPIPLPVNNSLKNVPVETGLYAEEFSDIGGLLPYQWYFE